MASGVDTFFTAWRLEDSLDGLDLRSSEWIPWRRRRSGVVWGPIAMITDGIDGDDPVTGVASPRPDFDGALLEFLVGILSVALRPADMTAWKAHWFAPPAPDELQRFVMTLPDAFRLDADDGPRFLQDFVPSDLAEYDLLPIDRLAIDSPGEQGIKLNKTLFVKPARFARVSRPVAAMAIITMQTYAPAGGQGNRTSMRGGGPLTTLADPRQSTRDMPADQQPLWYKLWINAETQEEARARAPGGGPATPANIFPWLAPTRVSDNGKPPVTPAVANAMQAYFGMPRRLLLSLGSAGYCDLTGRHDHRLVTGYRMRNFGVEYDAWKHPLSPHYRKEDKDAAVWLPIHPQPGGLTWKDWPDLALASDGAPRVSAACIAVARRRAKLVGVTDLRLHAFGYDMDNMKARAWVSTEQPLLLTVDDSADDREWLALLAEKLVTATRTADVALSIAIKAAWFDRPADAGADASVPKQRLWAATEAPFFAALRATIAAGFTNHTVAESRQKFFPRLCSITMDLMNEAAPLSAAPVTAIRRYVSARHQLSLTFKGYGKLGMQLYEALQLEPPVTEPKPKKKLSPKRGARG